MSAYHDAFYPFDAFYNPDVHSERGETLQELCSQAMSRWTEDAAKNLSLSPDDLDNMCIEIDLNIPWRPGAINEPLWYSGGTLLAASEEISFPYITEEEFEHLCGALREATPQMTDLADIPHTILSFKLPSLQRPCTLLDVHDCLYYMHNKSATFRRAQPDGVVIDMNDADAPLLLFELFLEHGGKDSAHPENLYKQLHEPPFSVSFECYFGSGCCTTLNVGDMEMITVTYTGES